MTIDIKTIAAILATLGFEVADDAAFVEDVASLVEAGDREGLIARIAGGASYGEAAETADEILRRARGVLRDYVLVETIPVSDRGTHETTGIIAGSWPLNGARRVVMHRDDAEALVGMDAGWSYIVRAARDEDAGEYDVILDASSFAP